MRTFWAAMAAIVLIAAGAAVLLGSLDWTSTSIYSAPDSVRPPEEP